MRVRMNRRAGTWWRSLVLTPWLTLAVFAASAGAQTSERLVLSSDRDVQTDLDLVSLDLRDGQLRKVTTSPQYDEYEPRASVDGTRLVFVRSAVGRRWPYHEPGDLWIINADGSGAAQITDTPDIDEFDGALSPDGRQVVFTNQCSVCETHTLWVADVADGKARELIVTQGHVETPAWSPDGRQVAYAYYDPSDRVTPGARIWVVNADGTGARRLTAPLPSQRWDFRPGWSPDGRTITFGRYEEPGDWEIWTMNRDGSGERKLTDDPLYSSYSASWAPDGSRVAFTKHPTAIVPWDESTSPTAQLILSGAGLYLMKPDGSEQTQVAWPGDPWSDSHPAWTIVQPSPHEPVLAAPASTDETAPRVAILAGRLTLARRGTVPVRLLCGPGRGSFCRGRLELWERAVRLGARSYRVRAGAPRRVAIRLSRHARRRIKRSGVLRVQIVAIAGDQPPHVRRALLDGR